MNLVGFSGNHATRISDWVLHPTRELLFRAEQAIEAEGFFTRHVSSRVLVVAAVGCSALESIACALTGLVLAAAGWCRTTLCISLRGTSLVSWAVIGYLSNMTFEKSAIRWVQFIALQALLGYANPKNWWAQLKLWGRVMHGMGTFAVSCASSADKIEKFINRFASWHHVSRQFGHSASLAYFNVRSLWNIVSPSQVVDDYKAIVEDLPEWRPLEQRVKRCLRRNWGLVASVGAMAVVAAAHIGLPGYEGRMQVGHAGARHLWDAGGLTLKVGVLSVEKLLDFTVMPVWHYFSNRIDNRAVNEVLYKMNQALDTFQNQCSVPG